MTCLSFQTFRISIPWAPKTMKNEGFGHLKTRILTIKTFRNVGFGGPMVSTPLKNISQIAILPQFSGWTEKNIETTTQYPMIKVHGTVPKKAG